MWKPRHTLNVRTMLGWIFKCKKVWNNKKNVKNRERREWRTKRTRFSDLLWMPCAASREHTQRAGKDCAPRARFERAPSWILCYLNNTQIIINASTSTSREAICEIEHCIIFNDHCMCIWQPVRSIAVERERLGVGRVEGAAQCENIRECDDVSFRCSVYERDEKRWNVRQLRGVCTKDERIL